VSHGNLEQPAGTLLYCRPGFERECAQEITDAAAEFGISGFVKARENSGFAVFIPYEPSATQLRTELRFDDFVFARQLVHEAVFLEAMPTGDRITPLLTCIRANFDKRFGEILLETADTNEAKELSSFLKKFGPAFESAARNAGILGGDGHAPRLHVFFLSSAAAWVGVSDPGNDSSWHMGIPRLKLPRGAPSRSAQKLAEALSFFLSERERADWLREGRTAVDLGAAPGGWTWQLVQHGLHVTAIDNGALDPSLLASNQVEHLHADGFHWQPKQAVDWLVCDMIEKPARIAKLMAQWLGDGHAKRAIFNLKLPMKKRREEVLACRATVEEMLVGRGFLWRAKQLYHDREEVTVSLVHRRG
jgi:23S rRNA (cytidine2498-2'-O)-methyltransferase